MAKLETSGVLYLFTEEAVPSSELTQNFWIFGANWIAVLKPLALSWWFMNLELSHGLFTPIRLQAGGQYIPLVFASEVGRFIIKGDFYNSDS